MHNYVNAHARVRDALTRMKLSHRWRM